MVWKWIGILGCLSLLGLGAAQGEEQSQFRQVGLLILQQRLAQPEVDYLESTLGQIAREALLPNGEARIRLIAILDTLDAQLKQQGAIWERVVAVGGEGVSPKMADKFLAPLLVETRKLLVEQNRRGGDYSLQDLIKAAAQKAKCTPDQGNELLLKMLSIGSRSTMPRGAGIPDQIGVLVEVDNRLAADTTGAGGANAALDRTLMSVLLAELPTSGHIKWAGEKPDSTAAPEYWLAVMIHDLQDHRAGGQMKRLLTAELTLKPAGSEVPVYRRPFKVDQYTSVEKADTPAQWAAFYKDTAQQIRTCLDEFLSAR